MPKINHVKNFMSYTLIQALEIRGIKKNDKQCKVIIDRHLSESFKVLMKYKPVMIEMIVALADYVETQEAENDALKAMNEIRLTWTAREKIEHLKKEFEDNKMFRELAHIIKLEDDLI